MEELRLYNGRLKTSATLATRLFCEAPNGLLDLNLLCASYLAKVQNETQAYQLADLWMPPSLAVFLQREEASLEILAKIRSYLEEANTQTLSGPSGERLLYATEDVKLLCPVEFPEKLLVVGFSDHTDDIEAKRNALLPTAFYKLSTTICGPGDPIPYPKFTQELDCDLCLAVVIGKPGKRIAREHALNHVGGFTLLLDVTARDVCREESKTRNSLLGKNIRASSPLGPSLKVDTFDRMLESCPIELSVDGTVRQKFTLQDLIFSVEDVVTHWSAVGLCAGDVLALGASLAVKSDSPIAPAALQPGSTVRCYCSAIGEMSSTVVLDPD